MNSESTPMRWPAGWKNPSTLALLKGTPFNYLLFEKGADLGPVVERARQSGFQVSDDAAPPAGIVLVDGEWTGVKTSSPGSADAASAGPTGIPWVDSNGWMSMLEAARNPSARIWVDTVPKSPRLSTGSYLMAAADAATYGGRLIVQLDPQLASMISAGRPEALDTWKKVSGAAAFFTAHNDWLGYTPEAVLGIISDYAGENEVMSLELLNLVARTNQQYKVILKEKATASSFKGLRALLYADVEPPSPELRESILAFVRAGGMLITVPKWGALPPAKDAGSSHSRYRQYSYGEGRIAVAIADPDDPYVVANDSVLLISHRYDLLRFWNAGAVGSSLRFSPDRSRRLLQVVFYSARGINRPTVRVAGSCRSAMLWTLDQPGPRSVQMEKQADGFELYLPEVAPYAAVELAV
jgi:hypothetical protein